MNRRRFLGAAGIGIAAAALGRARTVRGQEAPAAPAPAAPRARKLKKAVKIGMVEEGATLRDKFALLRDLGFDGVELDSPSALDPDLVLAAKAATGLEIPGVVDSVHWSKPLGHPDPAVRREGRAALETALRDAARYGASTVLLVPAVVSKQVSYADAYRLSQEEIRAVLPLATELGVKIALENVWNHFLLSPLEAARYVDEFASDRVGWTLDIGNLVNYGWPEQWVATLGQRILKLDIKEYSRKRRDEEGLWKGFDVELLEGDCDWPAVMRALDAIGYEGWATAEIPGGGRARLAEIAARMDRIFAA